MEASLRRGELTIGVVLILLAAYVLWQSSQMPGGTVAMPGPGMLPSALGALLAVTGAGLVVQVLRRRGVQDRTLPLFHVNVLLTFVVLTAVPFAFERFGFLISMSVFVLILLRAFSRLGWLKSTMAAVAGTGLAYVLFKVLLGVQLPKGIF
jgi:putative tricarboxylic transport membrane protein